MTARNASTNDPASSSGTRNSRTLARNTSTTAMTAPRASTLSGERATPRASPAAVSERAIPQGAVRLASSPSRTLSRSQEPELEPAQVASGALQDHGLVDHGQLQMGARVVDRQPAGLGDDHDHQRSERQQARRGRPRWPARPRAARRWRTARWFRPGWTGRRRRAARSARAARRWSCAGSTPCHRRRSRRPGRPAPAPRCRAAAPRRRRTGRRATTARSRVPTRGSRAASTRLETIRPIGARREAWPVPAADSGSLREQLEQVAPGLQHAARRRDPQRGPGPGASPRPAAG